MAIQRRQSILAKSEAVHATDPVPVGTDAVRAIDDLSLEIITETGNVEPIDAGLDGYEHVEGLLGMRVGFTTPLYGSGAAGTAPDWGALIKACGFAETIVAVTSTTYAPASVFGAGATGYQSVTLYIQDGVLQWQLHGCYGTVGLAAAVGTFPKLAWQFVSLYERPTDVAPITAPTYDTTRPQPCRGLAFNIGGDTPRASEFNLALNRETHMVRDMSATYGLRAIELGRMAPTGDVRIQEQTLATADWWTRLDTPTNLNWSFVFGGTAGNIATIRRPAANTVGGLRIRDLSIGEDNGVKTLDLGFTLGRHAIDTELEIVLT